MHKPALNLLFLVVLFIMPQMAYAQAAMEGPPPAGAAIFSNLPARAKVFAFGVANHNQAARVDVQIDPSTMKSSLIKITVNSPVNPAILLLQANDATIWHLNWTQGSQIAAVYISGRYKQVVSGLPQDIPVFISDQADPANASLFSEFSPPLLDPAGFNDLAQHLFQRDVEEFRRIKTGEKEGLAGPPLAENSRLESAEELDLEKFRLPPNPLSGKAGLRDALARGLIREITEEDIQQYTAARAKVEGLSEELISFISGDPFYLAKGYVVLSPDFIIPDGLYDGYKAADYLLPPGMPEPKGPRRGFKIYSYDQLKAADRPPLAETCRFADLPGTPPLKGRVYGLRDVLGQELDFQIEGSPLAARLMEVKANSPSEPVFLLLQANSPTIWHFSWTPGTQIGGVFISSREPQIVSGLPKDVPLLINNWEKNPGRCPKLEISRSFNDLVAANNLSRGLFHKGLDKIYSARGKNETDLVVGQPLAGDSRLESAEELDVKKYRDPNTLLTGKAGLNEAIGKGLIRAAIDDDIRAYKIAEAKAKGVPDSLLKNLKLSDAFSGYSYVVLSPDFTVPANTAGQTAFYVPEGLPKPKGDQKGYSVYSYDDLKAPAAKRPIAETCKFPDRPAPLPAEAKVYAIGPAIAGRLGSRLDFYIDDHNMNQPHLMKITVNSPSEPVILMLDTSGSTIWHFSWTKGTKIAAVYIGGSGRQVASGLPPDVPVLIDKHGGGKTEPGLCPEFSTWEYANSMGAANDLSRHLFNRDIYQMNALSSEEFVIGRPLESGRRLESAEKLNLEKFRDPQVPLPGPAGLDEAVAKGLIRPARPEEVQDYLEARAKAEGLPDHIIKKGFTTNGYAIHHHPYVVLSPDFVIPQHLYEENSASFIVPEGGPEPKRPAMSRAKAPFAMPKKIYGHHGYVEAVASRIYSYADLKSLSSDLYNYEEGYYIGRGYRQPDTCFFPKTSGDFPAKAKVYAVNADAGAGLDFAVSGSPKPAGLMKVSVNTPTEPALLLLKAKGPTIWHFSWTKGSKIAGVYITSEDPQLVSGLPRDTPLFLNTQAEAGQCSKIELSSALIDLIAVNNLSKQLFNRSIESIAIAENGEITVGRPLAAGLRLHSAEEFDINKFRDPATPPAGQEGLDEAVAKGLIKKAEPVDIENYISAKSAAQINAHAAAANLPAHLTAKLGWGRVWDLDMSNPYLVLSSDFIIPVGLNGGQAATFIVPVGLSTPQGPRGDCRVYSYDGLAKEAEEQVENYARDGWISGGKPQFASTCRLPRPVKVDKVYAVGASPGHELDFQIDDSGDQARLMKLTVNAPGESTALFLDGRKPIIWHINWTKGTKISTVIIRGGRHKQTVSGLPEDIQILIGQGNGHDLSLCPPNFEVDFGTSFNLKKINSLSRHFFKKDIDDIEKLENGRNEYVLGPLLTEDSRIESAAELDLNKFRDPNKPLAGQAGLRAALAKSLIRKATWEDIQNYLEARNKVGGLSEKGAEELRRRESKSAKVEGVCSRPKRGSGMITDTRGMDTYDAYVVLSPDFVIPPGLSFPKFYVPKGLPAPQGGPGCSEIYVYDELR